MSSFYICKSTSHFFSKNTCELDIVLTRTVHILTTNKFVKLTMLLATGPWSFIIWWWSIISSFSFVCDQFYITIYMYVSISAVPWKDTRWTEVTHISLYSMQSDHDLQLSNSFEYSKCFKILDTFFPPPYFDILFLLVFVSQNTWWNGKHCRLWPIVLFAHVILSEKLIYEFLEQLL